MTNLLRTSITPATAQPEVKVERTGKKPAPWHWKITLGPREVRGETGYRGAEDAFQAGKAELDRWRQASLAAAVGR